MENSKGHESHGRSWKMMIMSWNFYNCTEKFCSCNVVLLAFFVRYLPNNTNLAKPIRQLVVQVLLLSPPLSRIQFIWKNMLCRYVIDFLFLVMEKSWKVIVEKEWSPWLYLGPRLGSLQLFQTL